jgi:hypothetical protein
VSAQAVIDVALSQIGYIEAPVNRTKYGRYYGLDEQPWCAMALSWCHAQVGQSNLVNFSTSRGYAYTPSGVAGFKARGAWGSAPRLGAHVFYQFSGPRVHHVGLVVRIGDGWIEAAEGNTSRGSAGSQRDGGGFWLRRRSAGIVGYGYPNYSETEEDDMTDAQANQLSETLRIVAHNEKRMDTLEANIAEIETRQGQLKTRDDLIIWVLEKLHPAEVAAARGAK